MKRRLFLTGPIGCGKSTAIGLALGDALAQCGGFRTRRYTEPHLHFTLESPDGTDRRTFLDFADGGPKADLSVFSDIHLSGRVLLLDEIGGIELLNPAFAAALESALSGDVPILGVIKAEGSSDALAEALGLTEAYRLAAARLRHRLQSDPETLVYRCGQYDENALRFARQWAEAYLRD